MSDNSRKTPLAASLPAAMRSEFGDLDQLSGRVWPCHVVSVQGQVVTIAFDLVTDFTLPQVTVPIYGAEWVRNPTQVGDKGICLSADAFLGAITGLGGSTANLTQPGNLGALVFMPIGSKNWTPVDGNVLVMYGPNGVTLRDKASHTTFVLTGTGITATRGSGVVSITDSEISLMVGSKGISITSSGTTIDGKPFLTHEHSGVQTGASNTGGVV